jgi:ubiquitin carboxyl-terminal hydrolase 47
MDLSLPVKNNPDSSGISSTNKSVEAALEKYMKPERLEGDNQYMCSNCNLKVNATKGLKITALSDVLTLVLNRYTIDRASHKPMKIHDKVTFPFVLNGNNYLQGYEGIKERHPEEGP